MRKQFNCYSLRLAGYLLLNKAELRKVIKQEDGNFLFIFNDEEGVCGRLLEQYRAVM